MASTYLSRTPSSASNRKTWTWSGWVKRSDLTTGYDTLFSSYSDSNNLTRIVFWSSTSNQLTVSSKVAGNFPIDYRLTRVSRDTSAWYHIVVAMDTTQSTDTDRLKVYINGVLETAYEGAASSLPSQNEDTFINNNNVHYIGQTGGSSNYFNGLMANVEFVDGLQLTPAYFGSTNTATGIWTPSGATAISNYGTNGFKLKMDTTSPGADTSGKGNTFTASGTPTLTQGNPQNNWCTFNSLVPPGGGFVANTTVAWSKGNTVATLSNGSGNYGVTLSTIGMTTGKFYCEIKYASSTGSGVIGIRGTQGTNQNNFLGGRIKDFAFQTNGHMVSGAGNDSSYGGTWGNGDIIGIALDLDNNKLYFSKNGTFENSGNPTSGSTGTGAIAITPLSTSGGNDLGAYFFGACEYYNGGNAVFSANFGSPAYAISSGNADANGYGNFEYAVPSGYYSLNTKNLGEFG